MSWNDCETIRWFFYAPSVIILLLLLHHFTTYGSEKTPGVSSCEQTHPAPPFSLRSPSCGQSASSPSQTPTQELSLQSSAFPIVSAAAAFFPLWLGSIIKAAATLDNKEPKSQRRRDTVAVGVAQRAVVFGMARSGIDDTGLKATVMAFGSATARARGARRNLENSYQ